MAGKTEESTGSRRGRGAKAAVEAPVEPEVSATADTSLEDDARDALDTPVIEESEETSISAVEVEEAPATEVPEPEVEAETTTPDVVEEPLVETPTEEPVETVIEEAAPFEKRESEWLAWASKAAKREASQEEIAAKRLELLGE